MTFDGMSYNYLGISVSHDMITKANDDQLDAFYKRVLVAKAEEQDRLAAVEQARSEELARLQIQAEEQARIQREQDEREAALKFEAGRIEAEKKAIEAIQLKAQREKELDEAKKLAAEQALKDKEEFDRKEKIAAEKKAARAPDKKKLMDLAALVDGIKFPEMKTAEGNEILQVFGLDIMNLTKDLRQKASAL
jgi:hypothetical protein